MNPERLIKVGQKSVACICFTLLVSVLLIGCIGQNRRVPSDLDEIARLRRSSSENDTVSTLLCSQKLVPVDKTIDNLVDKLSGVTDDYVSLVRLSISYTNGNLPEQDPPVTWHWGLGARGRTMLRVPYDNHSLSLTTLNFGLHSVAITLNSSQSQNDSFSDICLGYSLSNLLQQVRMRVENAGSFSDTVEDDVICKERFSDSPSFGGTIIPGYSLFELQASTYYECWNVNNMKTCVQDNCDINRSFRIDCTIVNIAFWITSGFLIMALICKVCRIYCTAYDYQDEILGERVNILRINLIPPVFLMFTCKCCKCCECCECSKYSNKNDYEQLQKKIHCAYWAMIYFIPFIIHLVAFLCNLGFDEYAYRSDRRRGAYKWRSVWLLDFALANLFYGLGAIVFLIFIYKYRPMSQGENSEKRCDLKSKTKRLICYFVVCLLCFWRFSATVMLLVEIVVLTAMGIAMNIKFGSPIWINYIIGAFFCISSVIQFFDSYQHLFSMIHSVGTKIDREGNFPNKIFEPSDDGTPQLQFKIKSNVLGDIIRKWLPFGAHVLRTFWHIIISTALLVILGFFVTFIDRLADTSSLVEYFITAFPLFIAAVVKLKGIPLTAGGKAKNCSQDNLLKLEEDLRQFAKEGKFPPPEASSCPFFAWCEKFSPCCAGVGDQQEAAQDPAAHDIQPQNPQSGTSYDRASSSVSISMPAPEFTLSPSPPPSDPQEDRQEDTIGSN